MIKGIGRVLAACVWLIAFAQGGSAEEYRLGEGIAVKGTPLYVGGYFSLDYDREANGSSEASLDDLALMFYGSVGAWSGMAEIEWSDLYRHPFDTGSEAVWKGSPHAERVYLRYEPSEHVQVTVGKFNTPIGYWNRMPINVLRDTTSSPQVVYDIFPRFTTGVDMTLTQDDIRVTLLLQGSRDLDAVFNGAELYNNFDVDKAAGIGIVLDRGGWSAGVNAGAYEEVNASQTWGYLYVSAQYWVGDTHVMAESGYRQNTEHTQSNFGAYLQLAERFYERHYAVLRGEYVNAYRSESEDTALIAGYTYRPLFPVALKGEYQVHSRHDDNRLIFSFSVLF